MFVNLLWKTLKNVNYIFLEKYNTKDLALIIIEMEQGCAYVSSKFTEAKFWLVITMAEQIAD